MSEANMNSCIFGSKKGCIHTHYTQWNQMMQSKPTFKNCPSKCIFYKPIKKGAIDKWT